MNYEEITGIEGPGAYDNIAYCIEDLPQSGQVCSNWKILKSIKNWYEKKNYLLPDPLHIGSIDLLSHFTKVKCDSWT